MLQTYLNVNLLPLTDDGDLKKLKKSSEDLVKKNLKDKEKIISYALSAVNPATSADDADIIEVRDIILKNWTTFTANTKDTPLTYIRAVMLDALESLSQDIEIAAMIWLACRNLVKQYKYNEQEKSIVIEFLTSLGKKVSEEAYRTWSLEEQTLTSKLKIEYKPFSAYLINATQLQKLLEDASGPHNSEGVANYASPNPYWPNSADTWVHQFVPKATNGIKTQVDLSLKAITSSVVENQKVIEIGINNSFEKLGNELLGKNKSVQIRSELLWWKEALYSPLTDESYRELQQGAIEIIMAYDYSTLIPLIYPKSVDYFLMETYAGQFGDTREEKQLTDLLTLFENNAEQLKLLFPHDTVTTKKTNLLKYLIGLIWGTYSKAEFEKLLGFSAKTTISLTNLTLWLFHDFQLHKLQKSK